MRRHRSVVLIALLAAPLVCGGPAASPKPLQAKSKNEQEDAIDRWARDNYARALDLIFPDRCASPPDARWIACARIVPAYKDEFEYSLSVERRQDGTVVALIDRPKAQPVYAQLRRLKKEHPKASSGALAKLIPLESQAGDQRRFPGLARLADEFEKIRFSPALSDEIMMDPTQYRFRVRSFSGDQLELLLHGPGAAASRQPQGLIQWAESVRELMASAFN